MTTRSATVVITGSGTVTCQSVIKALRTQTDVAVHIVTVDASDQVAGRYFSDLFHTVPSASDPHFVDALLEICQMHQADLLIPIVDYEFKPLSEAIARFEEIGCLLAVSPPTVIEKVNNKLASAQFFSDHGFAAPRTWSASEALANRDEMKFPLFLKPAIDGRSSIDCYRINNLDDFDTYLKQVPDALVQEFIDAPEFTADVLADWNSEILGLVVRQRIETKGGVSYKGRTVNDPRMEQEVIRLVRLLGIHGPANVQAFRRGDEVLFIEVNPRFSGALALSLAAGLNSPLLLVKLALGLSPASVVGQTETGLTMLRYWDEVFVDEFGNARYPDYCLEPPQRLFEKVV